MRLPTAVLEAIAQIKLKIPYLQRNVHKTDANYLFRIMQLLSILFLDNFPKNSTNDNKKAAKKESIYSTYYQYELRFADFVCFYH